jgi:hypothetical protein
MNALLSLVQLFLKHFTEMVLMTTMKHVSGENLSSQIEASDLSNIKGMLRLRGF